MTEINPLGKNPQNKPAVSKECAVKPKLNESLFLKLAKNKDGKISNQELYECGCRGNDLLAMSEVLFFAERDVNKWFMKDKNHNGVTDSAEEKMWDIHNTDGSHKIGDLKPEEFAKYQSDWNNLRAMKASDFRDLLKPENKDKLEKFEENSNMTVRQIVDWIDIIESATGKDFDNNDWKIDSEMFHNDIMQKVNGTYGDDKILEGKTRSDVPLEKQELLKYLEEHGLLLEQFRE